MLKTIIILFISLISIPGFLSAQKLDLKKDGLYVDAVKTLSWNCKIKIQTCPVSSEKSGNKLFSISSGSYPKWNNAAGEYKNVPYRIIRFIDFELEFVMAKTLKKIFTIMIEEGLIEEDGTVSQEAAEKFARSYHDKVPGWTEFIIR